VECHEATGDVAWLRDKAWPVLQAIARFWASRAVPSASGGYDINAVMGPDEYNYPAEETYVPAPKGHKRLTFPRLAGCMALLPQSPAN
jgi:hypothetical protein